MKNMQQIRSEFLTNRDETGKYLIVSERTGRTYFVEPVGFVRTNFGDVNPATKQIEGSYGQKYTGSVGAPESQITKENGFAKIYELGAGCSPQSEVEKIDSQYPDKK